MTSGVKKERKVLDNKLDGITRSAISRLLRTAGVKRVVVGQLPIPNIYKLIRKKISVYVNNIVKASIVVMEHKDKKMLSEKEVIEGCELNGLYVGVGLEDGKKFGVDRCDTYESHLKVRKDREARKAEKEGVEKTKRKHKSGSLAMLAIKYYQKHSGCLSIVKSRFADIVREAIDKYADSDLVEKHASSNIKKLAKEGKVPKSQYRIRATKGAYELIQYIVENCTISLLSRAYKIAINSNRISLKGYDIITAYNISGY